MNEKGNLTIRYYVGRLIKEHKKITFDKGELVELYLYGIIVFN